MRKRKAGLCSIDSICKCKAAEHQICEMQLLPKKCEFWSSRTQLWAHVDRRSVWRMGAWETLHALCVLCLSSHRVGPRMILLAHIPIGLIVLLILKTRQLGPGSSNCRILMTGEAMHKWWMHSGDYVLVLLSPTLGAHKIVPNTTTYVLSRCNFVCMLVIDSSSSCGQRTSWPFLI